MSMAMENTVTENRFVRTKNYAKDIRKLALAANSRRIENMCQAAMSNATKAANAGLFRCTYDLDKTILSPVSNELMDRLRKAGFEVEIDTHRTMLTLEWD